MLDGWTEKVNEKCFLGIPIHLHDDISITKCNTAARIFKPNLTTTECFHYVFLNILNNWEIPATKISCKATDNGANMLTVKIKTGR